MKLMLQEKDIDLIILDLNMPDGYGTSLLPCLNRNTLKPIPTVVFSIDPLDKKYSHLVSKALLKSITSNKQLYEAIMSAIYVGDENEKD